MSYVWNGIVYDTSGVYVDTLFNVAGCDSIATLDLTINYSTSTSDSLISCDSAMWNGQMYYSSGIYVDTLQTVLGCDSIVTMDMTINNSVSTNDNIVSCDSAMWNGEMYYTSGIYIDTLQTVAGCDSVVTMDMVIHYANEGYDTVVACDVYVWNGIVYDTSGVYVDTLFNVAGCDSIATLDLTINYSTSTSDSLISCDSAMWNGQMYYSSGIYVDTLQTVLGCDSIITMDMTIKNSYLVTDTLYACDSILWGGAYYYTSGTYYQTLQTVDGCDSIVEAYLDINQSITLYELIAGCDMVKWKNNPYYSDTILVDTLSTATGCDSIEIIEIMVNSLPMVYAGLDLDLCIGDTFTLNAQGNGAMTWNNTFPNGQSFTADSSMYFVVQLTDSNACVNYDTLLLNVAQLVDVYTGQDTAICQFDSITLSGSGADFYIWSNANDLLADGVPFVPTASSYYMVEGFTFNGCVNSDSVYITVHNLPNVNAGLDTSICNGDSLLFLATGAVNYQWSSGVLNGNFAFVDSNQTLFVTAQDSNGCANSDSISIVVNALPTVNAGVDTAICIYDSVYVQALGANQYTWSNGIANGSYFIPDSSSILLVSGQDNNGCINLDTLQITVHIPFVNAGFDQEICLEDSVVLIGQGSNISWSNNVLDSVYFLPDSTEQYVITVQDTNGCVNYDTVIVTVFNLPTVDAGVDSLVICEGDELMLEGSGASAYEWSQGVVDGVYFLPTIDTTYIVEGVDTNGCVNIDSIFVSIAPLPTIDSVSIVDVQYGNDAAIFTNTIGGTPPYDYDWDIDGFGDLDDGPNLFYINPGQYQLNVYDSLGCMDSTLVDIASNFQIYIAEAITPNNDGFNDTWVILGLYNYPQAEIKVFNSFGQIVFENEGYYQYWNGKTNGGQLLPASDYYYVIYLDPSITIPLYGTITITY